MQKIKLKKAAGYVIMPGIIPRVKDLFTGGTGILAFLLAGIFRTARLLPPNHPYVNPVNMRKFGIRDVFAQAGSNLVFDRNHLDQIAIFGILMLGFVLFILQFFMLAAGFIVSNAHAIPLNMFTTPDPTQDIAFELLDRVFGIPDVFDSCVAQLIACGNQEPLANFPTPFNIALQNLFRFYSTGLLVVGVLIFLYYVFVVVMETAQTGTPFGRRFAHIWAPIRLVFAIGLLIPISNGLNSAQYIVLYAAKEGSGFATNAWNLYNSSLTNGLGVENESLYARPKTPDTWPMVKFMLAASTCKKAYEHMGITDINAYIVKNPGVAQQVTLAGTDYADALAFYNRGDVLIRFGKRDASYTDYTGNVRPYCGEMRIPTNAAVDTNELIGPYNVQLTFFSMILFLWDNQQSDDFAEVVMNIVSDADTPCNVTQTFGLSCEGGVTADYIQDIRYDRQTWLETEVQNARDEMMANYSLGLGDVLERGWGGAGIWYNRIAEVNGAFFSSVNFVPTPTIEPFPMQQVKDSRRGADPNIDPSEWFVLKQSNEQKVEITSAYDQYVARVLQQAFEAIGKDATYQSSDVANKNNIFKDGLNKLFGTTGLFTMRENTDIHPLAQLVGLGKGIIDATVRNLFTATIFSVGGGFMSAFSKTAGVGGYMTAAASILVTIATISLVIGFTLYYMLPFLPFMYFFFAVGAWVKAIFEAMVGVPLWALGHLRIDGHGLPGESALDGYFMIFEIFLRPILTVFGMIGGLITFAALAKVLNEIFKLVTDNLSGFNSSPCLPPGSNNCVFGNLPPEMLRLKRDVIDEFFFTIIYTIVIYMMATGSFKMIDQLPKGILRWMGVGVRAFTEQNEAEEGMNKYLIAGAANMSSKLGSAIVNAGQGTGRAAGIALGGDGGKPGGTGAGRVSQNGQPLGTKDTPDGYTGSFDPSKPSSQGMQKANSFGVSGTKDGIAKMREDDLKNPKSLKNLRNIVDDD